MATAATKKIKKLLRLTGEITDTGLFYDICCQPFVRRTSMTNAQAELDMKIVKRLEESVGPLGNNKEEIIKKLTNSFGFSPQSETEKEALSILRVEYIIWGFQISDVTFALLIDIDNLSEYGRYQYATLNSSSSKDSVIYLKYILKALGGEPHE